MDTTKIKYIHASAPRTVKTLDTEVTLKNSLPIHRVLGVTRTQAEWDKFELSKMKEAQERGLVCSYEVIS